MGKEEVDSLMCEELWWAVQQQRIERQQDQADWKLELLKYRGLKVKRID